MRDKFDHLLNSVSPGLFHLPGLSQ